MTFLQRATRERIKQAIRNLHRHTPDPAVRDIALFASRRGGSSLLMSVLSADRSARWIDQPFHHFTGPPFLRSFEPRVEYGAYLSPSEQELKWLEEFFGGLLRGELNVKSTARFWESEFWHATSRTVLKINQGKPLMEWFDRCFDLEIVWLIRHPIAQSLSVMKAGWPPFISAYLNNETFVSQHLNDELAELCRQTAHSGSMLEQHVVTWCLEMLSPLRQVERNPHWLVISYEQCLQEPELMLRHLRDRLNIQDMERMQSALHRPSRTTRLSNTNSREVLSPQQIEKWRRNVSEDEIRACFEIVEAFDIDMYCRDRPGPADRFWFREAGTATESQQPPLADGVPPRHA